MTLPPRSSFVDSLIDLYDSGSSEGDSNLRLDEFEEAMEDLGRRALRTSERGVSPV